MSRWSLGQQLLPLTALRGLRPVQLASRLQKALRALWSQLIAVSEVAVRQHYRAPWDAAEN